MCPEKPGFIFKPSSVVAVKAAPDEKGAASEKAQVAAAAEAAAAEAATKAAAAEAAAAAAAEEAASAAAADCDGGGMTKSDGGKGDGSGEKDSAAVPGPAAVAAAAAAAAAASAAAEAAEAEAEAKRRRAMGYFSTHVGDGLPTFRWKNINNGAWVKQEHHIDEKEAAAAETIAANYAQWAASLLEYSHKVQDKVEDAQGKYRRRCRRLRRAHHASRIKPPPQFVTRKQCAVRGFSKSAGVGIVMLRWGDPEDDGGGQEEEEGEGRDDKEGGGANGDSGGDGDVEGDQEMKDAKGDNDDDDDEDDDDDVVGGQGEAKDGDHNGGDDDEEKEEEKEEEEDDDDDDDDDEPPLPASLDGLWYRAFCTGIERAPPPESEESESEDDEDEDDELVDVCYLCGCVVVALWLRCGCVVVALWLGCVVSCRTSGHTHTTFLPPTQDSRLAPFPPHSRHSADAVCGRDHADHTLRATAVLVIAALGVGFFGGTLLEVAEEE